MSSSQQIIDQTITWIHKVVVGCNFCPFAARTLKQHHVHYQVEASTNIDVCLGVFLDEIARLGKEIHIETIMNNDHTVRWVGCPQMSLRNLMKRELTTLG